MKRYFYYKDRDNVDSRHYHFYLYDTETELLKVIYKDDRDSTISKYRLESVNKFVQRGIWIEIPAQEAVLML